MNVAIFGGTFDPVHRGHLAVARAAARRFRLERIYFVPADLPPHKRKKPITPFLDRYAMLALALAGEERLVASAAEFAAGARRPNYTVETVARFRRALRKGDRLYLLLGADQFRDLGTWHRARALLRAVEVIVATRPGFSLAEGWAKLPRGARVLVLETRQPVSATEVRRRAARGRPLRGLVPPAVADYIRKTGLYRG
ncbi:MAG TPA: nicotinate-nucleotide adenylyltransferase [Terriglobales bacterium]|jgi:nicotinate-nucleotide adenylyltransferase|nr:nicotinate-nucleotide adenylyltransferase [Terriglobales bacterium]